MECQRIRATSESCSSKKVLPGDLIRPKREEKGPWAKRRQVAQAGFRESSDAVVVLQVGTGGGNLVAARVGLQVEVRAGQERVGSQSVQSVIGRFRLCG